MEGKIKTQDWPNIHKYKNENEVLKESESGEKRIVYFGDSITEGWKIHNPDFFTERTTINRGIGGQTTSQMLLRFRPDVIELNPNTVVILAGTNDIAQNTGPITQELILGNLISMCELAKANNIKVILCSILPAFDFPWRKKMEPAEKIVSLNTMILEYSNANDIYYIDYHSAMMDERKGLKSVYSKDGVHPNKQGYLVMENILKTLPIM